MVNTTIQYDNIIFIIIVASAPASSPRRGQTLEAEARTLEAEARTLEAEATKFWPREASRPRLGLEA